MTVFTLIRTWDEKLDFSGVNVYNINFESVHLYYFKETKCQILSSSKPQTKGTTF